MTKCSDTRRRRKGQTILFLLMALVILFFAVIWNLDLHKIFQIRFMSQNAGDSAALMAARWQGITLNLIGDLNIMHAVALANNDRATASSVTNLQARLCFVGPLIAYSACQQAAKNNKIYRNETFDQILREHAAKVRDDYTQVFDPPYVGAWEE